MKTIYGKINFHVSTEVPNRNDGLELIKLQEKLNELSLHMKQLELFLITGEKITVNVNDADIVWDVAVDEIGQDHSWFEVIDGVQHLTFADDFVKVGDVK